MTSLDPFILPADVVIAPLAQLAPELREQIGQPDSDYTVTRPRSRTSSSVVDARTAALLERFRSPTTIVDAVIAFGAAEGVDPRELLDDAFSVLGGFVNEGVLVSADSELAQVIASTLLAGERIGCVEVLEAVHVIVDTEVYLARAADGSAAALKVARAGAGERMHQTFAHEAAILESLDGRVNPRLLECGVHEERPFLAMSWCAGIDVYEAAADARRLADRDGALLLLELGERLIEAYAHLHAQGVIHGDVHPRNAFVDGSGAVTIIDYGLAGRPLAANMPVAPWRGGVDFFMEPEIASARLTGDRDPLLSFQGEQYSLGALLYLLLTGAHTHAFSLEHEEMLRQLLEQSPLPFARHGARDLPAIERTLARALNKDPAKRYRSSGYLLRAFRAAATRDRRRTQIATLARTEPGPGERLLEEVLARLALGGELFTGKLAPPTASAMNGGAGFAYALLRIAALRDDEDLLSLADLWSTRAAFAAGSHDAFWNEELEIVPETFGENSFYHHAAGVHGVLALVAHARCDEVAQQAALDEFVAVTGDPGPHVDVAFGRAGLLLGCSLLLEASSALLETGALRLRGAELRRGLWDRLEGQPALAECTELRSLGAAHGWAGYLFALLRWSEASRTRLPDGIEERLQQLAALGCPAGRGTRWPQQSGGAILDSPLGASWCNGAAGLVHLWVLAHRLLGDERFAQLAQQAGWSAYEGVPSGGDLCCGFAGRAHALLCLYQHTGEAQWLLRARVLADHAAASVQATSLRRDSLYKGEVGAALLSAELSAPEHACMPLFAGEHWRSHTA
ncbi:MAG TPA: lanthionine synthetase LanC family protein [Solirubrobacteraceae bacterium]|jgi:serine/threonine-protein kinase